MREFFEVAWDLRRKVEQTDRDRQAFELVAAGRDALQAVHSKATFDIRNLETVFGAFEMASLFGRLHGLRDEDVAGLPGAIRHVIVRTIERGLRFQLKQGNVFAPDEYRKLASTIKTLDGSDFGNVGVITFNYDLGLDRAIENEGFEVDYCTDTDQAQETPTVMVRQPTPRLPVAKLHGSLNWWICPKCGRTVPVSVNDFLRSKGLAGDPYTASKVREFKLVYLDQLPGMCTTPDCRTPTIQPFIVPPTWSKGEFHRQIKQVWRRAAEMLRDAENIIVMGYSWPTSDEFFHNLFALGTVGPTFLRRFWIFDVNPELPTRYLRLLGPQASDPAVGDVPPAVEIQAAAQLTTTRSVAPPARH